MIGRTKRLLAEEESLFVKIFFQEEAVFPSENDALQNGREVAMLLEHFPKAKMRVKNGLQQCQVLLGTEGVIGIHLADNFIESVCDRVNVFHNELPI